MMRRAGMSHCTEGATVMSAPPTKKIQLFISIVPLHTITKYIHTQYITVMQAHAQTQAHAPEMHSHR